MIPEITPMAENEAVSVMMSLKKRGISKNLTRRYPPVMIRRQSNNNPVRNFLNITFTS